MGFGGDSSSARTRRVVVTGCAGFIGSATVAEFLDAGAEVIGIDCFTDYYERSRKDANLAELDHERFRFVETSLRDDEAPTLFEGADAVVHLAGQPGVRGSWEQFRTYLERNIALTHRVLQGAVDAGVPRLVYASSSSIYGTDAPVPTTEPTIPRPTSAYGLSKLAGEHLCEVAARQFGLTTMAMRYFTVYGPRQRPDMAIGRIVAAAVEDQSFVRFGDGGQVRDFTYVGDVARANRLAAECPAPPGCTPVNIAGGSATSLNEVITIVGELVGRAVRTSAAPVAAGDVRETNADTSRARALLGWTPEVPLRVGLQRHVDWFCGALTGGRP